MRVQDHIKLSAAATAAALPWLKKDAWIPFAASILIDVDHYLWFALVYRTLSLRDALRFYTQANPPRKPEMKLFHQPPFLALLLFIAVFTRSKWLWLIISGLLFHVSLDVIHGTQMSRIRRVLHEEARGTCSACGLTGAKLEIHTLRFSRHIIDRYNLAHYVALCPSCHEKAHEKEGVYHD